MKFSLLKNADFEMFFSEQNFALSTAPTVYQSWKLNNSWLTYEDGKLFCTVCKEACNRKLVVSLSSHDVISKETWVENGYQNFKHGAERIKKHATSALHMNCAKILKNLGNVNVVQHLSTALQKEMMDNRTALKKVFSTLKLLGRQGLAIRGHDDDENSNFMVMLKARAEDVVELESWLNRTGHKWLHHDIQNEILQAMATKILSENIQAIKDANFYSILIDETADITRTEQISIYFRAVSADLLASEYFMGFYATDDTKSRTLFDIVTDVLLRFDLPLSKLRGQCYDGAANVSGKISGLQQRIKEIESRALEIHCNAHNLNLSVQDGMEKVLAAKKFIGEVKDLINFVRDSPKRIAQFKGLQEAEQSEDKVPALVAYCPTR